MSRIDDDYASAVARGAPSRDVVGAVGLAGKHAPLATGLLRLFVGDNRVARDLVHIMASMLVGKAYRLKQEIARVQAEDMARAVLAWHRDGTCRHCNGIGMLKMPGTPHLSGVACSECRGTGRMPFNRQFAMERLELARWLAAEIEREQRMAGLVASSMLRGPE